MAREPAAGAATQGAVGNTLRAMIASFGELDQLIDSGDGLTAALTGVITVAAARIAGAAGVSVSTYHDGRFATVAATDERATRADELQEQVGNGPCMDTLFHDSIYNPQDLAHDARWPEFGKLVSTELGLHSMLSYRLLTGPGPAAGTTTRDVGHRTWASLNVYATSPHRFDEEAVMIGLLLATHARSAITAHLASRQVDHLDQALRSSREIGTAIGILMARHRLGRDEAFELLRTASQRLNRKLRDVATYVADTGELPPVPAPRPARRRSPIRS